jgi:subtilisin family serine protease
VRIANYSGTCPDEVATAPLLALTRRFARLTFPFAGRTAKGGRMDPLELVGLPALMALTRGKADLVVGLVDGPVAIDHPDLAAGNVRTIPGTAGACRDTRSASCRHGTFVAGILAARRGAGAPAIAPDCTLLVHPIFLETTPMGELPSATPGELAEAIVDCVDAGARVLNLSAALAGGSIGAEGQLEEALWYTVRREVLVVAAAGNQGAMAGSAITRHPWVIPVVAYAQDGLPRAQTNLGRSMGSGGLGGPGEGVESLTPGGESAVSEGTSIAAPFVTGAAALLWSAFPAATAVEVKHALLASAPGRRRTVAPPLLDAWAAYQVLSEGRARRAMG